MQAAAPFPDRASAQLPRRTTRVDAVETPSTLESSHHLRQRNLTVRHLAIKKPRTYLSTRSENMQFICLHTETDLTEIDFSLTPIRAM